MGIFADAMQVGLVLAFQKLLPSAKKINIMANLKNIFSKKNLVEFRNPPPRSCSCRSWSRR